MEKNKSLILITTKLVNKSKQASYCSRGTMAWYFTCQTREKGHLSIIHFFGSPGPFDGNVLSCIEGEVRKLQHFSDRIALLWTGLTKYSVPKESEEMTQPWPFPPLLYQIASQGRYIPPSVIGANQDLSALCQRPFESKNWSWILSTSQSRHAAIASIFSINTKMEIVKQSLSHSQTSPAVRNVWRKI